MPRFFKLIITIVILSTCLLTSQQAWSRDWRPVRGGILFGISGMALVEQQKDKLDFLVVHDNKQKNQSRLAIVSIKGKHQTEYLAMDWPSKSELPIDLEAITSIPGKNKSEFIALTSLGKAYHLKLDFAKKTISVLQEFNLPGVPQSSNFESFGLQNIANKLVAIWAHRGAGEQPAIIYWGIFNLSTYQITLAGATNFKVPVAGENVRHISDIKVDSAGIVYITSASDFGDDGPFESSLYIAGYLGFNDNKIAWRQNSQLVPLYHANYRKIEGMELVPGAAGGVVLGTDDENLGSSVYLMGGGE